MAVDVTAAGITWAEFATILIRLLPRSRANITPDARIDRLGPFDAVERTAIRQAIASISGRPPDALLDSMSTLGDALDWWVVRESNGSVAESVPGPAAGPESLATREVLLRPLENADIPVLYRAALSPGDSFRWRFRGATPSFAEFSDALYHGTLAQFAVVERSGGSLHGLVALYNPMHEAGWAYIGFQRVASHVSRRGQMLMGMFLLIDFSFRTWPFRKLCAEVPGYNFDDLLRNRVFPLEEEGCLKEHLYHANQYFDLHLLAIDRAAWGKFADEWWPILCR